MSIKIRANKLRFTSLFCSVNSYLTNQTIISSGLSLPWGTINRGGYTMIGNLVVINIRVTSNQILTAGTTYTITGFPLPLLTDFSNMAASCSVPYVTKYVLVNTVGESGVLQFVPNEQIATNFTFLFSACYIKQ